MNMLLQTPVTPHAIFVQAVEPVAAIPVNPCPQGAFAQLCSLGINSLSVLMQNSLIIIFVIAILLTLFFLIFGGFKWITSQGEKEGVEKARGTIIAAVLGLIIVFLSFFIVNLILQFFVPGANLSNLHFPTLL